MEPHDEMRRLRACFGEAVGETAPTSGYIHGEPGHSAWITAGDAAVESRVRPAREDAVAELRAILRADTSGAVAEALAAQREKIAGLLAAYLKADNALLDALNRKAVRDECDPLVMRRIDALDALTREVTP